MVLAGKVLKFPLSRPREPQCPVLQPGLRQNHPGKEPTFCILEDGSLPVPGVPQVTPRPRVHPSGMKQWGWSHQVLGGGGLGCLPPSLACSFLGDGSPVPAPRGVETSWELAGVVSARFEQSFAKPSPRLILICVLRGGGDATPAAREGGTYQQGLIPISQPTRSLPASDPASQAVTSHFAQSFCCLART